MGEILRIARKYKNSGNEVKEYLKTKDITLLRAAIFARFERKFAPIEPQKEQERRNLHKRSQDFQAAR
jgi:hypothetical protein